ncbi:uncharacterized protein [Amphiura filiformis]|uniref:uncharacterized protein n=1 Tax=Amphiura filiformis TaxID=82378 RepID=UPI003B21F668
MTTDTITRPVTRAWTSGTFRTESSLSYNSVKDERRITTDMTDSEDSSLLHKAVKDRRLHQFRLLMSLGVDVDKKDPQGRTPMMVATTMEPEEFGLKLMRMCIKHNANVNEKDKRGRSVLGYVCVNGKPNMAKCLLQSAPHLLVKNLPDTNGDVPLNLAAAHGHDGIVKRLIQSLQKDRLPVDVRNKQGCTALILASKYGHYKCAQVLLEEGNASANIRDNVFFMSPLEWAHYSQSHFERELKLIRVINVSKSTRSELLNLRAPAWCDNKDEELNGLPSLPSVLTSGERPNFQKKKQLISQLHTRQVQLNSLVVVLAPRVPEKVSYSRNVSLDESTDDQIMESVSSVEETIHTMRSPRRAPLHTDYNRANSSPEMPFLCSMFKLYEGNVGVRPSQSVGLQAAAALAVTETGATTAHDDDDADATEMDTPSTPPAHTMSRRKSKANVMSKRHSMHNTHSQNLAVPQVLRKTKTTLS